MMKLLVFSAQKPSKISQCYTLYTVHILIFSCTLYNDMQYSNQIITLQQ